MVDDHYWMQQAFELAKHAQQQGEVPIGAVIVANGELIAEGWNQPISQCDPTAHAEVVALRAAAKQLNNYRMPGTTLYVTLEPCAMCAGAIIQARIQRLVYATSDPRAGAAGTIFNVLQSPHLNHRVECEHGIMAEACSQLLKDFFQQRR
jgi:tRNA(adenine34) deaminase